ncbi:MAG: hypothetical protein ACLFV1_07470 [Thiohalophilus sp.]
MKGRMKDIVKKLGHRLKWGISVGVLTLAVASVWSMIAVDATTYDPDRTEYHGWGADTLSKVHEGIVMTAPINIANACGLGASSCFKCHNGKRAEEPSDELWHSQHAEVNHSCKGCHAGNDRLMRENMAHRGLINDPRKESGKTCASCHSEKEVGEFLKIYAEE